MLRIKKLIRGVFTGTPTHNRKSAQVFLIEDFFREQSDEYLKNLFDTLTSMLPHFESDPNILEILNKIRYYTMSEFFLKLGKHLQLDLNITSNWVDDVKTALVLNNVSPENFLTLSDSCVLYLHFGEGILLTHEDKDEEDTKVDFLELERESKVCCDIWDAYDYILSQFMQGGFCLE